MVRDIGISIGVVLICILIWYLGYLFGSGQIETVYIQDDGEGGIMPAPEWDPDTPRPGDPLYVPDDWAKVWSAN